VFQKGSTDTADVHQQEGKRAAYFGFGEGGVEAIRATVAQLRGRQRTRGDSYRSN
jgi:hypothetical protein